MNQTNDKVIHMDDVRFRLKALEDNAKEALEYRISHTVAINSIESEIRGVKTSIDDLAKAINAKTEADEGRRTWFGRTIGGIIIAAVVGWVLAGGLMG